MNLKVWYITNGAENERELRYLALHRAELWTIALSRATMFLDEGEALAVVQKYPNAKLRNHEVKPLPTPHSIDESFANIVELLEVLRERARGLSRDNVDLGGRLAKAERERDAGKSASRNVARIMAQLEKENEDLRKRNPNGAQPETPAVPVPNLPQSVRDVLHFLRTTGRYLSGNTCADFLERKGVYSRLDVLGES